MTREEFSNIAKGLRAIYQGEKFMPDKDAFDMWYAVLGEYDYQEVAAASKAYIATEKFAPTPAGIIEKIAVIKNAEDKSEMAVWDQVRKAIGNSAYHAEEEFNKLDDIAREVIGSASALREMGRNEDFNDDVEKSLFMKAYSKRKEYRKNVSRMPVEVRQAIESRNISLLPAEEFIESLDEFCEKHNDEVKKADSDIHQKLRERYLHAKLNADV